MGQQSIGPGLAQHLWLSDPKHVRGEVDFRSRGSEKPMALAWRGVGLLVADGEMLGQALAKPLIYNQNCRAGIYVSTPG